MTEVTEVAEVADLTERQAEWHRIADLVEQNAETVAEFAGDKLAAVETGGLDDPHWRPRGCDPVTANPCRRCGRDAGPGNPRPDSCGECPARKCVDCHEPDDRICSCWISLEGMALADIKATLALGDLSVETP